ncbi:crossover junction endodeoxyribonuclease RuvC [Anatilimnocola sp. NA78]|uniref:crossover junction endodeoxyribonuclease RuvC n=1 Tax=Anatilimnocola sp. NA78 TaxID=3415683 RepID=UPI003CE51DB8
MNILALDPASNCGWAHSNGQFGTWRLRDSGRMAIEKEHVYLERYLERAIESMGVEMIATENAGFGSQNPEVQARHNERLGIIRLVAARHQIEVQAFAPSTIKLFATGEGHAKKPAMVAACKRLLKINVTSDDEADAIWILELAKRRDCWPATNRLGKQRKKKGASKRKSKSAVKEKRLF